MNGVTMNAEQKLAEVLKALGDGTRLRILKVLAEHSGPLCVGALARKVEISQPAASQHLRVLKALDIVESSRMGVHVHYRVRGPRLLSYQAQIDKFIERVCTPPAKPKAAGCPKAAAASRKS
jgi:DNA-binding transcriptional ArsR family regulator